MFMSDFEMTKITLSHPWSDFERNIITLKTSLIILEWQKWFGSFATSSPILVELTPIIQTSRGLWVAQMDERHKENAILAWSFTCLAIENLKAKLQIRTPSPLIAIFTFSFSFVVQMTKNFLHKIGLFSIPISKKFDSSLHIHMFSLSVTSLLLFGFAIVYLL